LGTTAHDLCSTTFVSGLDPDQVFRESIEPRPGLRWIAPIIDVSIDRQKREVRASLAGTLANLAVFHEGAGCVLVHGDEAIATPSLAAQVASSAPVSEIAGPEIVEPASSTLKTVLDEAFEEPQEEPHRWTKAVVIVRDGRVIAERYAKGYGIATQILGFSMTKSVTNALVGILVQQRRLAVEAAAPVASWRARGDLRGSITIEQLMRMNSGLALDETGTGFDPSNQMFYDEIDMAAYAQRAPLIAPPGTRWSYSSASTHLVARIVRDQAGGTADAVQRFAFNELFDPLGMRHVTLEMDATGTPIGAHYMLASARDWARFGNFFLNDGVVGGRRLLPEGWVKFSTTPTLGTAYGAGWWTNRGNDPAALHRIKVGVPADAYFAFGNLGQRIAVIPSERLVIVRLAQAHLPFGDMAGFERLITDTIASVHSNVN